MHSVQSFFSSIDLGSVVDAKLKVNYVGGDNDKERLKVKRKAVFTEQVRKGIMMLEVHLLACRSNNMYTFSPEQCTPVHLYTCRPHHL